MSPSHTWGVWVPVAVPSKGFRLFLLGLLFALIPEVLYAQQVTGGVQISVSTFLGSVLSRDFGNYYEQADGRYLR